MLPHGSHVLMHRLHSRKLRSVASNSSTWAAILEQTLIFRPVFWGRINHQYFTYSIHVLSSINCEPGLTGLVGGREGRVD